MRISRKDQDYINKMIRICFLSGAMIFMGNSVYAADITTTTLPTGGTAIAGGVTIPDAAAIENYAMNISQTGQNAIIRWEDFSIGTNASVTFTGPSDFSTLNYVNGGNMSEIYGSISAANGNIYIVNPAGVFIGKSAQINVGSLYVSNQKIEALDEWTTATGQLEVDDMATWLGDNATAASAAELMSLGEINATQVTFDGDRVVLDVDRVYDAKDTTGSTKLDAGNIKITTTNADDVVLGYTAYTDATDTDGTVIGYKNQNSSDDALAQVTVNTTDESGNVTSATKTFTKADGYMWVENVTQLQAINANATTLAQNYALKNTIDATETAYWNQAGDTSTYYGFASIGKTMATDGTASIVTDESGNNIGFSGKFDGLGFSITDLTINRSSESNVGLFGYVSGSVKNLTVSGSITGYDVVGIIAQTGSTATVDNIINNQAAISGRESVGGIIGYNSASLSNVTLQNEGTVTNTQNHAGGIIGINDGSIDASTLINNGTVLTQEATSIDTPVEGISNTGGIIGYNTGAITASTLTNSGSVSGNNTVGGVLGYNASTISNSTLSNSGIISGNNYIGGVIGQNSYIAGSTIISSISSSVLNNTGNVTGGENIAGIIGYNSVEISDSTLTNEAGSVTGTGDDIGGIIGQNLGALTNVSLTNYGAVEGSAGTGGIIGLNGADADISGASTLINEGTVSGYSNVGGILGQNDAILSGITMQNTGTVIGDYQCIGGIIGFNNNSSIIYEENTEDEDDSWQLINSGEVSGGSYVGGIIGYNLSATISNADMSNTGTVSATGQGTGGLIGRNANSSITGSVLQNSGNVTGAVDNVGGIIGNNYGTLSTSELTNSGEVIGDEYVGGLIGLNQAAGTIIDSTLVNQADVSGYAWVGGVIGRNYASFSESNGIVSMTNLGSISGDFRYVGGVIGQNDGTINTKTLTLINGAETTGDDDTTEIITISGSSYVGGVIGQLSSSIIGARLINTANTIVQGNTDYTAYMGGVIGFAINNNDREYTITSVYMRNSGTVSTTSSSANAIGGVIGGTRIDISESTLINEGDVTGVDYTGGVIGSNQSYTVSDSTFAASITNSTLSSTGTVQGRNYVGGLIGRNDGTISNNTTDELVNTKTVSGTSNVGGLIGYNTGTIIGYTLVNSAAVTGTGSNVGGIFGYNSSTIDYVLRNSADIKGATSGGSATGGLIGYNTGNISTDDDLVLENSESVTVSGMNDVGGLIGYNSGSIKGYTLVNNGTVSGTTDVGGIIGYNSADITKTSAYNTVDGKVSGTTNVGGLIGQNTGKVEGGRDDDGNYYAYQIYNNGTVSATSSTVGGLIGLNAVDSTNNKTGTLIAGYNTGSVSSRSNVGGIVGSNQGVVDQVFNTLTGSATISGTSNVGGIIGSNSGTLTNAYNTSTITSTGTNVGNVVGGNTETGTISYVYATNSSGSLIGSNANTAEGAITYAYSFVENDTSATEVLETEEQQQATDSYDGLNTDANSSIWKFYDGYTTPLLRVFLTKATYTAAEGAETDFTYNTKAQGFVVKAVDNTVTVYKNDGVTVVGTITVSDSTAAHNLADYLNTYVENSTDNLLEGGENINAGTYAMVYSQQINTSDADNPNNLGYDIETSYKINKAEVTLTLADIYRVYGSTDKYYYDDDQNQVVISDYSERYSFSENVNANADMLAELIAGLTVNDGSLSTETGRTTQNASTNAYTWTVEETADIANNYDLSITAANAYVEKATLSLEVKDVSTTYGIAFAESEYGYENITGYTNGDTLQDIESSLQQASISYTNSGEGTNGRKTEDVGRYSIDFTTSAKESALNNYTISTTAGIAEVLQAALTITLNEVQRTYGSLDITSGGYTITYSDLANGDSGNIILDTSKAQAADTALTGEAEGRVTYSADKTYTWLPETEAEQLALISSDSDTLKLSNYKISFEGGNSIVNKATLTIQIGDVSTTYGTPFEDSAYSYAIKSGITNDDDETSLREEIGQQSYANSVARNGTNNVWTDNAGTYDKAVDFAAEELVLTNYNVEVIKGTATINPKAITTIADDQTITQGATATFTGTDLLSLLTNGDTFASVGLTVSGYGVEDSDILTVVGTYDDSIILLYTFSSPEHEEAFRNNYTWDEQPGTLTVLAANDEYEFGDKYSWGKEREERERKAEVYYEAGGMSF